MNIATRLRYALARFSRKAASYSYTPSWARQGWLEPSFDRLTREGYMKNAAVFMCIQHLGKAYQQPRIVVKRRDGQPQPNNPLQRLLDRPGLAMSYRELAQTISTFKAIGGVCYLFKVRNGRGLPIELQPFHRGQMRPVAGEREQVAYYEYDPTSTGQWMRVDKQDVIALKWPSIDPFTREPVPPLVAVAREVDMDTEATRYAYALLANDATPRTMIEVDGDAGLTATEIDAMKAQFYAFHGGDMRGSVAVLQGGKLTRASLNMEELAFDALRRVPEARISAVFGVPPEYSGLTVGLEHSTYNNATTARAVFYEDTIMQLCALDADELTHDLAQEFGDNLMIEHDFSKVVALQENQDAVWTRVSTAWNDGLLGQREARRLLGLADDLPPDDMFKDDMFKTEPAAPEPLTMPNLLVEQRGRFLPSTKAAEPDDERELEKILRAAYLSEV